MTVQFVIDMYANQQDNILDNPQASVSQVDESGSYHNCYVSDNARGYASSSPDANNFGAYPYCNLDCNDTGNYGKNCYKHGNTPGKTGMFITYNSCSPTGIYSSQEDFIPGAYPWLGNPVGNQTTGNTCNYFPKVINPKPISTDCTNSTPYSVWSVGPKNVDGFCVSYGGDTRNKGGTYQCATGMSAFCVSQAPDVHTIPSYWTPHSDTSVS